MLSNRSSTSRIFGAWSTRLQVGHGCGGCLRDVNSVEPTMKLFFLMHLLMHELSTFKITRVQQKGLTLSAFNYIILSHYTITALGRENGKKCVCVCLCACVCACGCLFAPRTTRIVLWGHAKAGNRPGTNTQEHAALRLYLVDIKCCFIYLCKGKLCFVVIS